MSDDLHSTRLRWSAGSGTGAAKLRGVRIELTEPPRLPSVPDLVEIDYIPEFRLGRIRERHGAWRDMEGYEMLEADAFLRETVR